MFNDLKLTNEKLPDTLPIFPLAGVLLLPGLEVPLNIFEPRYINMIDDALATPHRLIGLAQPVEGESRSGIISKLFKPKQQQLYITGCAGRIRSFTETEDGRYLISLQGISRFDVSEEISTMREYRRFKVDFTKYIGDIRNVYESKKAEQAEIDRKLLIEMVDSFMKQNNIEGSINSLKSIEELDANLLVNFLCSYLPFVPQEKQLFLEATSAEERSKLLMDILRLASNNDVLIDSKTIH